MSSRWWGNKPYAVPICVIFDHETAFGHIHARRTDRKVRMADAGSAVRGVSLEAPKHTTIQVKLAKNQAKTVVCRHVNAAGISRERVETIVRVMSPLDHP